MADLTNLVDLGGLASTLFPIVIIAMFLIAILLIGAVLYWGGMLKRYKYKVTIWEPRADGSIKEVKGKGGYLKNGKFEVAFGFNDKMVVIAPQGACIRPDNTIHGYSKQRNDIAWIHKITVKEESILLEPLNDPGIKVTIVNGMKDEVQRYKETSKWKEYIPIAGLIAAAIIIMLPVMMGLGSVADKFGQASLSCGASEVHIVYANETIAAFPGIPAPTRPAG